MKPAGWFNQRQHTRVNIDIDMHLVLVDAKSAGLLDGKERIHLRHGKISDLSVSGLKVKVDDLDQGWHFYLLSGAIALAVRFTLPGQPKAVSATAQVMRIVPDDEGHENKCTVGLKFIEISPEDKDLISSFVAAKK